MQIPLALYIHIPWCIRKCPYCDFNSHKSPENLPEKDYIQALLADLETDLSHFSLEKPLIQSIFIGGGTPSLFSGESFANLFENLQKKLRFAPSIEITLEANPGTVEQGRFKDYRQIGINRLSLGIQSFNPKHLKILGRIHDGTTAHLAIEKARLAGFDNINLDLMHSLPTQSTEEGWSDLQTALSYQPEHLSWYQLTLEPNTVFYKQKPPLPTEEETYLLEETGFDLLQAQGYERYEISAFARAQRFAHHNLNYWLFGDYLGIGAGAHGKITISKGIFRTQKYRQPKDYLNPDKPYLAELLEVDSKNILFEFALNATRLHQAIPYNLFSRHTGQNVSMLLPPLQVAQERGLVTLSETHWQVTPLGRRFTNDLQLLFL